MIGFLLLVVYLLCGLLVTLLWARHSEQLSDGDDLSPIGVILAWPIIAVGYAFIRLHEWSVKLWNWYAPPPPEEAEHGTR